MSLATRFSEHDQPLARSSQVISRAAVAAGMTMSVNDFHLIEKLSVGKVPNRGRPLFPSQISRTRDFQRRAKLPQAVIDP